jgi:cytochrome bd-type quinol oxidase subunit 2
MIANMPNSVWALPDAAAIAVRLIGMLPARPALGIRQVARRWPTNQVALVAAGIALIIAFIVMLTQR